MTVLETFFSVAVRDMERGIGFYVEALGAAVIFSAPGWTSLRIAGVRLGLYPQPDHAGGPIGLHFVVSDLAAARAAVERAGGGAAALPQEVAPGVIVAEVTDTEGNVFALRQA